ncbi:MAG: triose-phosphate isomerase [Candidatus Aenigmarchaeota archaeon]|nr:triose-phosphate isomerase [Candidatus Aenigmarchaeota archaeon]
MKQVLSLPIIMINFKTYPQSIGKKGLRLAKIVEKISKKYGVTIAVVPQFYDVRLIATSVDIPVFAQHVDPITPGAHTGHSLAETIKDSGAIGSLINHSEKRMKVDEIKQSVKIMRKNGLLSVVCVPNIKFAKLVVKYKPNFIAYEPPELIGSGRAVSKVKPEVVEKFSKLIKTHGKGIIPLCGAGITTADDVRLAVELGTSGVLLASAFVKAKDPKKVLEKMAKALVNA